MKYIKTNSKVHYNLLQPNIIDFIYKNSKKHTMMFFIYEFINSKLDIINFKKKLFLKQDF